MAAGSSGDVHESSSSLCVKRVSNLNVLLLLAAFADASSSIAQTRSLTLTDEQLQSLDPIGSCYDHDRSIDLHKVMFLENRVLDINWLEGTLRLSIERDSFYADEIVDGDSVRQHYRSVLDEIDNGTDLDIELRFAYLEDTLLLYWRETFQNRLYRQGLFTIIGPDLTFFCAGQGGRLAVR